MPAIYNIGRLFIIIYYGIHILPSIAVVVLGTLRADAFGGIERYGKDDGMEVSEDVKV